jgi:hypothetical protein
MGLIRFDRCMMAAFGRAEEAANGRFRNCVGAELR